MSPAKTPKKPAEDDIEAVSVDKKVKKLKTENTVTPEKSTASKVTIGDNDSSGTPSRKITRNLKTPSKESGVEQTKTLNTPKVLCCQRQPRDPSPLQTRSARKKKAGLGQNATPKLISPIKSETSGKAESNKSSRKSTLGRLKIKQEPKRDEDGVENKLDSDDLDSDDMDEEQCDADQNVPHKMEPKKETPVTEKKTEMVEEANQLPEKTNKVEKFDLDLEEAAQTPLPMSPEAPAAPNKQAFSSDLGIKSPTGVNKNKPKKSETDSPKVQMNVKIEEVKDDLHSNETSQNDDVTEQSTKSPGKRTKKQKDGTKKAKKGESDTEETTAKFVQEGVETAAAESVPVKEEDVPEVALSGTEIPSKSPGKRTKGPKDVAKKAKLAETSAEEILDGKSSASSEELKSPKKKEQERKLGGFLNLRAMSKGNASDEEKIEKLRQQLIDAGKDTGDIEVAVIRFRKVLLKRLQGMKCKNCFQRGHLMHFCPYPHASKCYKCGSYEHFGSRCSIKAAVYTYAECDICRQTGHLTKFCPDKKPKLAQAQTKKQTCPNPPRARKCYKCGSNEHSAHKCSIKFAVYTYAECDICRQTGHLSKFCPNKKPELAEDQTKKQTCSNPPRAKCYKCGTNEHFASRCSIKGAVFTYAECNICRKTGHMTKFCPEKKPKLAKVPCTTTAGDEVPTKKSKKAAKIQTNPNANQKEQQAESKKKISKKEHVENAVDQKESVVSAKKKNKAKKSTEEVKENVTAPTEVGDLKKKKRKNQLLSAVNEPEVNGKPKAKAVDGELEVKKSALKMEEPSAVKKVLKKQKVES